MTSVVYQNGTESLSDAVVGRTIVGNLKRPNAKITDLDVDAQDKSTIYGMNFGITWNETFPSEKLAFYGKWTPSIIAQNMWQRMKCYSENHTGTNNHTSELYQDTFPYGALSTTVITDLQWYDLRQSTALRELKSLAEATGGNLSVRITLFYYTRNLPSYVPFNATLGYVVGTIGITNPTDTFNVPGQRIMNPSGNLPIGLTFPREDLCYHQNLSSFDDNYWISTTPFEVDLQQRKVHVDLSNSLSVNFNNTLYDIGKLRFGTILPVTTEKIFFDCIHLYGKEDIPYLSKDWLKNSSGIYTFEIDDHFDTLPQLVLVQVFGDNQGSIPICMKNDPHLNEYVSAEILIIEPEYFIRPSGYYVDRLVQGDMSSKTFYVTRYGQPVPEKQIKVCNITSPLPWGGVVPDEWVKQTDDNGYVTFQFFVNKNIPFPREYDEPPCNGSDKKTIPIDGQVYYFGYSLDNDQCDAKTSPYSLAFLAFSDVQYTPPYTWIDDVQPVLAQYAQIAPCMNLILDMGSYDDVKQSHNIELLNMSLRIDFYSPAHMPVTRDLSPTRRRMILAWLKNPLYDSSGSKPPNETEVCQGPKQNFLTPNTGSYFQPPRCQTSLPFDESPVKKELYYAAITNPDSHLAKLSLKKIKAQRPLFGFRRDANSEKECTKEALKKQFQTAIELEFSTIPAYATSLYSIAEGCNLQIYELIRSIIMQEMLHMTQAANTLIALGGQPLIDDNSTVPSYPTFLPGGVLPGLQVTLEKLSLEHVYEIFMGIEIPQKTDVVYPPIIDDLYTIGEFYKELNNCIIHLNQTGEDIFDPTTADKQVQWPWNATQTVGSVITVTDTESAVRGINEIVSQGEGAGLLDPDDIENNTLAHFFKFEEIVCQNRLEKVPNRDEYSYSGPPIPFNQSGVWPMRKNPSIEGIKKHTNCYTESRVFHGTYRALLRKMQEVFNGSPNEITMAVELMESLQVHAKKLMWTKFRPESKIDQETCGPVWEYEWPADAD